MKNIGQLEKELQKINDTILLKKTLMRKLYAEIPSSQLHKLCQQIKPYMELRDQYEEQKRKEYEKLYRQNHPWSSLNLQKRILNNAKKRAKTNNLDFNIELDDIIIPRFCPYLGIELSSSSPRGSSRRDVASLDRIDPTKGYIKGNIEVISHLANTMKNNATKELLITFANAVIKKYSVC